MTWSLFNPNSSHSHHSFADFLDALWNQLPTGPHAACAQPAKAPIDAWVSGEDAIVTVELPGVTPADINVSVEGDTLKVWGERKIREPAEGEHYHRRERSRGSFERAIEVPFRIDPKAVEAGYENGVLKVRLPRAAEYRPRRIEIKG